MKKFIEYFEGFGNIEIELLEATPLVELKRIAEPSSKEAKRILEVMLSPKYVSKFPQDQKNYEFIVNSCCPRIEEFILVALTWANVKMGSGVGGLVTKTAPEHLKMVEVWAEDVEDLFKEIGMYYVKWLRRAPKADFYSYEISMKKEHLERYMQRLKFYVPTLRYEINGELLGHEKIVDEGDITYANGDFYDYPRCCVYYRKDLRNYLISLYPPVTYEDLSKEMKFAMKFFCPCTPRCYNAEEKGRLWLDTLRVMYGAKFLNRMLEFMEGYISFYVKEYLENYHRSLRTGPSWPRQQGGPSSNHLYFRQ